MNLFNPIKNIGGTIIINLGVLTAMFLVLETGGQLIYKIGQGQFPISELIWQEEGLFESHPFLAVVPRRNKAVQKGAIRITNNNLGQRISSKEIFSKPEPGKKRVVCLGGSTTFGVGVADEATYPYILQEKLGDDFQVFNLGVPGYGTLEAIIQLNTVISEIQPDYILLYQGWNDIQNYFLEDNLPDYRAHGKLVQQSLLKKFYYSECFALTKFTNAICNYFRPEEKIIYPDTPDEKVDKLYRRNLERIALLGTDLEAQLLFIPQVLNLAHFSATPGSKYWTAKIRNGKMPDWIRRFNGIMENSIADCENIKVVRNILDAYPWSPAVFIDEGHFSKKGNEQFVDILLPFIKGNPLYSYQMEK